MYRGNGPETSLIKNIKAKIKEMHMKLSGKDDFEYDIVLGSSTSLLIQAAIYALTTRWSMVSGRWAESPLAGVAGAGFFVPKEWQTMVNLYQSRQFSFTTEDPFDTDAFPGGAVFLSYYDEGISLPEDAKRVMVMTTTWPHFMPKGEDGPSVPVVPEDAIQIYDLCSLTGHCGSRLAWALVPTSLGDTIDTQVDGFAAKMMMDTPRDVQIRSHSILSAVVSRMGTDDCVFRFQKRLLEERWRDVDSIFRDDDDNADGWRDGIGSEDMRLRLRTDRSSGATPGYVIIECSPQPGDTQPWNRRTCGQRIMSEIGIRTVDYNDTVKGYSDGSMRSFSENFALFDITSRDSDFAILKYKLTLFKKK